MAGELCNLLALSYLQKEDFARVDSLLRRAEALTLKDPVGRAVTYNNYACYMRQIGKLHTALAFMRKALALEQRVKQGAFREDLFHRLNVIRLRLPALRERREDIPALARSFLQKSAKELGVEAKRLSDEALAQLCVFDFPGNVRQLENICHWLTVMAPAQTVDAKDLPPELMGGQRVAEGLGLLVVAPAAVATAGGAPVPASSPAVLTASTPPVAALQPPDLVSAEPGEALRPVASAWLGDLEREARSLLDAAVPDVWDILTRKFEAQLIQTALEATRGRRIEAAQKLGIGRNTITRKIQELGLDD